MGAVPLCVLPPFEPISGKGIQIAGIYKLRSASFEQVRTGSAGLSETKSSSLTIRRGPGNKWMVVVVSRKRVYA